MQDEIERQKLILLERTKRKETIEVTGKDRRVKFKAGKARCYFRV